MPPSLSLDEEEGASQAPPTPPTVPILKPTPSAADSDAKRPIPPLAIPLARPVAKRKPEAPARPPPAHLKSAPVHAWVDQSLSQQPTPWLPGDEARFQRGITAPREGVGGGEIAVLTLVVLAGASVAGWLLLMS
jgi:hypothetical protein